MNNKFPDSYFLARYGTDKKRLESFKNEKLWLRELNISFSGNICDVGCSTGEFMESLDWNGNVYGMEINKKAIKKAKINGIKFNKNILNQKCFFDVVIFRGTIQHLDNPFHYIDKAITSLKLDGYLIFLATPDIDSFYYRIFRDLPALDLPRNFYLPSFKHLVSLLAQYQLELISTQRPYLKSGYANPLKDFSYFFLRLIMQNPKFSGPFPGNMFNIAYRKVK